MKNSKFHTQTECIHYADVPERFLGAVTPPIFQNSLFVYPTFEKFSHALKKLRQNYIYTRGNNPTVEICEQKIARLEKGESAKCFGSGMGAITSAILTFLRTGDHIVSIKNIYGPAYEFLSSFLPRFNVETSFISGSSIEELRRAIKQNTKIIYLESPTTFTFQLQNLSEIAELAKQKKIVTIIDNTWATPYFQNPLEIGIDLVVHSCSKYLAGHSDVVAGAVIGKRDYIEQIFRSEFLLLGGILHPFEAWLLIRGLRTLPLRMERHFNNALKIANFLENHPKVLKVNYPLLPSHPQYQLAKKQLKGGSGLFSFELKTDNIKEIKKFVNFLRIFRLGVSWGGYESLVVPIAALMKNGKPNKTQKALGLSPYLIRLSVGLEDVEDLISDLEQALSQVNS
jgi:cystathionine beta-lyase